MMYKETMRSATKEEDNQKISEMINSELETSHNTAKVDEEKKSNDLVKATSAWENKELVVTSTKKDHEEADAAVSESENTITEMEKTFLTRSLQSKRPMTSLWIQMRPRHVSRLSTSICA